MKTFWRIEAKADGQEPAHIYIYDVIGQDFWTGEGVTAKQFVKDLAPLSGRPLVLHLNCAGGDMFEGFAILAALDAHQGLKTVVVESLAASMASVLAMAADKGRIQMAQNAYLMIHNPRGAVRGQASDLERMAALMKSLRAKMVATYRRHSTLSEEQLAAALDAETWYDASQAKAAGLASEIVGELKVAAALDGTALDGATVPEAIRALYAPSPADLVAAAQAALDTQLRLVTELEAKADREAAAAAGAKIATAQAAQAESARAAADLQGKLAAEQEKGKSLAAKLASLTGGLVAPVQSAAAAATGAPLTFAGAIDAIQEQHREWDSKRCWIEAKKQHPQLWEKAKNG